MFTCCIFPICWWTNISIIKHKRKAPILRWESEGRFACITHIITSLQSLILISEILWDVHKNFLKPWCCECCSILRTPLQGLCKSAQGLCSAHFAAWGEGSDRFYLILQYPKDKAPMWCTSTQETLVFASEFVFLKAKHRSMTVSH